MVANSEVRAAMIGKVKELAEYSKNVAVLRKDSQDRGNIRECKFKKLMRSRLPSDLFCNGGYVIDNTRRGCSGQTDIIIGSERIAASIFHKEEMCYPIDSVACTVEVKSYLRKKDLTDAIKNAKKLKTLQLSYGKHSDIIRTLFAYGSGYKDIESVTRKFVEFDTDPISDPTFHLICVLGKGIATYDHHRGKENKRVWGFTSASEDYDEVLDFIGLIENSVPKLLADRLLHRAKYRPASYFVSEEPRRYDIIDSK